MQVAAFLGEIVCTALPAISVLIQCSTPAPSASVSQYMITLALSYSLNNVQTWLFPWTLNHRTLTCLLLQPGSTGLFVPACMCVCLTSSVGAVGGGNSSLTDLLRYGGGNVAKAQFKAERGGNRHDLHHKHFDGYFITS